MNFGISEMQYLTTKFIVKGVGNKEIRVNCLPFRNHAAACFTFWDTFFLFLKIACQTRLHVHVVVSLLNSRLLSSE